MSHQNEPKLWYPEPRDPVRAPDDPGTVSPPNTSQALELSPDARPEILDDDVVSQGDHLSSERLSLESFLAEQDRARQLAAESQGRVEFDDAVRSVFPGAEITDAARQAISRFNPRDDDPQAFEFRSFVSDEFERHGYF